MRLGAYNITTKGITKAPEKLNFTKKTAKKIKDRIFKTALYRQRAGIKEWQNATVTAESILTPNNTEIIRIYKDLVVDMHLWALMQTIILKVIANDYNIVNEATGETDDEKTKLFKKRWFRKCVRYIVESEFYGFSLIQLGDVVDGAFNDAELVPREYVIQQKRGVKKNIGNSQDLIPFDAPEYRNWIIPVGEIDNLGLLHKAAPMVIKKKEVVSAWSEAAEIFGMPLRLGKTNIGDPERRENMEEMMENMGSAAWGVFAEDDTVEFVEGAKSDFFKIYKEFIETANSELSKGFLGQTGTTDEKSFTGAANVHESTLKDVIEAYIVLVEETTNEQIITIMNRLGLMPVGFKLKANNEQKLSLTEMITIVKELFAAYKVPADWILETFGVPAEEKPEPEIAVPGAIPKPGGFGKKAKDVKPGEVMKAVKNLYSKTLTECTHD